MKQWLVAVVITFFVSGCSSLQVQVDSDPEFDFTALSKFHVIYTKKDDGKDFTRSRISTLMARYFEERGYVETDKAAADFYLIFHLDVKEKSEIETNYETMNLYPGIDYYDHRPYRPIGLRRVYADPYLMDQRTVATTRTYEYQEGRLVVELLDVKQNAIVWQGIAVDELSALPTQEAKSAYINKVLEAMFRDFPSKKEVLSK